MRKMGKIVGICDNPNNYYYTTEIDEFSYNHPKEECGMKACKNCFYFVSIERLKLEW